jgi:hypothetical protein
MSFAVLDIKMLVRLKRRILQLLYKGEKMMGDRLKIFGIIAILGFMAGVIAQLAATYFIPWIISILPVLGGLTSFMISGLAGACLTVALVGAWAYLTNNRN